jgi:uncharacterized OB-fold protein
MGTSNTELAPITDGLFTWPSDEPQLIGSRCRQCRTVAFPAQGSCVRCTSTDIAEHLLAREGTLWTWTVQGFRPKSPPYTGPEEFVPFPLGYVELPGEVKVETRIVGATPCDLRIGMPMELAIVPFDTESGPPVLTFAFRPIGATIGEEPSNG